MNNMNKKGFLLGGLGVGAIAVLGAFSVFIIAMLLLFLSVNKFIVIGGGLVGLTLFVGLRGNFGKTKAFTVIGLVIVGVLFVSFSSTLNTQFGPEPSAVFLDSNLGLISMSVGSPLVEQAYFKSASGNSISVSTAGDRVQVCDVIPKVPGYTFTSYHRYTDQSGNTISNVDMTSKANDYVGKTYCSSFTPKSAGNYEVRSIYTLCPDIVGPVRPSDCLTRDSSDVKRYFLEVKAEEERCDKSNYLGDFKESDIIDNGIILKQKVYKVNDDCDYVVNYVNVMTTCNDGYVIEGTTRTSTNNEGFNCVAKEAPIIDDPIIEDPECETALMVRCDDGTEIVSKNCVDGFFEDANICPVIPGDIVPTIISCEVNPDQAKCDIPEEGLDEATMKLIAMIVIGIGAFAIILLFGLLIARKVRK